MSALNLQSLFTDRPNNPCVQSRYDAGSGEVVRPIAQDLLDMLLAAETFRSGDSLLSAFASLLKIPLPRHAMSVAPQLTRTMRIRRVKILEARLFAMAMADNLMFASARTNELTLRSTPYDARLFRTHWLWTLMPPSGLELLMERIVNWPISYIKKAGRSLKISEKYRCCSAVNY